jgi:ribosomal protein L11 methyltransferase
LLEAYFESGSAAKALSPKWGGRIRVIHSREWIQTRPVPPTKVGDKLVIFHDKARGRKKSKLIKLCIPHGLAFGSGEHATTFMLLNAQARETDWSRSSVLDLGTGSGVLALAARRFGARKIVATDFDPEAIRTARQNEALNFSGPLVRWLCADVKKLCPATKYRLVLANLFSGILCEASVQIAGSVSSDGQLWLSGILKSQEQEVISTYRGQGLKLIRSHRRGKWVMLQLSRAD